jgi:ligand-binding sensor domain-containing protein/signal transduction histidine kinase
LRSSSTCRDARMKMDPRVANAVAALAVLCFAAPARALDPGRTVSQYMHERWGIERGFIGGAVSSIAQTADGYLWIGTEKGLVRFDGSSFRLFQQANPAMLAIGPIRGLMTDAQGNLWVVLQNTKILCYRDGKFDIGRDEAEAGITSVAKRGDGTSLFASLAMGILAYQAQKFEFLTPPPETTKPSAAASPEKNDNLSSRFSWAVSAHGLAEPNSPVISMVETDDRKVWLGTQDKGLFYLKDGRISGVSKPSDERKINCLLPLKNGQLWAGTDEGLVRWNGSELTRDGVPAVLQHLQILSMSLDRDLNIWLGTSRGLFRYNTASTVEQADFQRTSAVTAIFEDGDGNLWTGTTGAIERYRNSAFVTYTAAKGLPSDSNGAIYVDSEQRTWFAPLDGGLHWVRGGSVGTIAEAGLDKDIVYSIVGSKNELWLGRQHGGLTHLRFSGPTIESKTYTHLDGLAQDNVYAVFLSSEGSVWAGTLNGGVSRFKDGRFTSYTTESGLGSNTVAWIAEGFDGTMWFATPSGLSALSSGQWRTYKSQDGLPSDNLNCLLEDSGHVLWIGSAAGLAFISTNGIQVPRGMPESLREQIFGMAEDRNGSLWIATANHILRVRRDRLVSGALSDGDVREYGLDEGLVGVEGVKRQQSVLADWWGRVWFSTNRGISVVDPMRAGNTSAPTMVRIEAVSADGAPVDVGEPVRIPSARQRIAFDYAGLSLSVPERVRYRYKLEGFDRDWSGPVTTREAVYTNLGPGSYQFRVIASNGDGGWNQNGASLSLKIVPEFYQTKWFLLLVAAVAGCLAWLAYQWHVQQVTARLDLQYKERLSERTRIARELHDTLLQSFQGLMLHFQRARNLLPSNPDQAIQRLDSALEGAEQAIVEGRNAIHDIRSSVLVNDDLAQAMNALGEELSASDGSGNSTSLNVVVEGAARPLDPVLRDEIYRILREALRNAYAHARAHRIEAEIAYGEKLLRVRIRDDGVGIDPHVLDHGERAGHWGLPGMRERAKQIGGELDVWSELGAGTEVELSVPASVVYRSSHLQTPSRRRFQENERAKS